MRLFWNRILCGVIYSLLVIGVAHSASAQNRKTVEKSDQTTLSEKVGREGKPAKRNESALRKGATSIPSQPAEEISGTVTEQDMVTPIPGATVEAWDDYPCGVIIGTHVTDGDGSYSISGLPVGNYYDVPVHKEGYCPQQAFNIPVLSADVNFSLAQIPAITPTATWTDFYGLSTNFFGCPVHPGDVITAFDPDGVLCGSYYVMNDGWYGLMAVYGDDTSTPEDEGAKVGDLISFRINCIPANVVSGDPTWTGAQVQVELEVPPPPDLIVDEFTADPMKQWAGQPIEITLRIKNQGVGDVISPFQSGVYDSP
ncbi:MAG: carboxypeptidase-like regulatory domain-containing protein, partial [Candidatus Zixiibacteriota bacterium]